MFQWGCAPVLYPIQASLVQSTLRYEYSGKQYMQFRQHHVWCAQERHAHFTLSRRIKQDTYRTQKHLEFPYRGHAWRGLACQTLRVFIEIIILYVDLFKHRICTFCIYLSRLKKSSLMLAFLSFLIFFLLLWPFPKIKMWNLQFLKPFTWVSGWN